MNSKKVSEVIVYGILTVGLFFTFAPFIYMISTSLTKDTYALPYPPVFFPKTFYYQNYIDVWKANNFSRFFLNSLLISVVTMAVNILVSSMTAFGFSKFQFKGKETIFKLFLFSMMVPTILSIIPQYTILKSFKLIDQYAGLVMLYVGAGIAGNTFFLRSFFEGVPKEMEESVAIDGGSKWVIFRRIILPIAAPAIGTFSIFAFSGTWDEFFQALVVIKTVSKRTLPIAIRLFEGQHATNYGLIFSASLIAVVPIILIFVIFNKQLIRGGITEGSVKA